MRKLLLFSIIVVFCLPAVGLPSAVSRKIIKVDLANQPEQSIQEFLKLGLDITLKDRFGNYVNVLVDESELQEINALGLKTEMLLSDADAFTRILRESGYLEHFHTYAQMLSEMQEAVEKHPNLVKMEDIGDSYEKTVNQGGYDIWAIKISDNVDLEENEPEVFFMANMHAREIITPEIIIYFMHYLVDNYGSDPYVTHLVNHRQIWLCPTFNPDGHEYVFTGNDPFNYPEDAMWWRKNMRDNNENGEFEPGADGVDLNRNFGYKWGYDNTGSSPYPGSQTYRGTEGFSEPESQAIRDFVNAHNFIISLCFHSYSQLWLYPWGYERNAPTPDDGIFKILADSCVAYNGYLAELAASLYPVNGDTDDWLYGEQTEKNKIFAFTPEVGNRAESIGGWTGFFPDTLYIEKQILENQGPMLFLTYAAGEEPIIEPELLPDTENPNGPYQVTTQVTTPIPLTASINLIPSGFKLFYRTDKINTRFDSTILIPTGNPDEYTGEIPGQGDNLSIQYYFLASDELGRIGYAPRGAPLKWFTFTVKPDTIPPVITHSPLLDQSLQATAFIFRATVNDNARIAKVWLEIRKNLGEPDSLAMLPTSVPNEYSATVIPDTLFVNDYFNYKITAVDESQNQNTTTLPADGFYRFQIVPGMIYDFEENDGNFISNAAGDWQWGAPSSGSMTANSGYKVWATRLNAHYSNNSNSQLDIPPIDLNGVSQASLSFWHWYHNESSQGALWDGGNVKISVDGGSFEVITPEAGYDGIVDSYNGFIGNEYAFGGAAENGNFWQKEYFDLTSYAGKTVTLRFHFASDDNTTFPGWYIDDVQILLSKNTPPVISNTTILPNTSDAVGPYPVTTHVRDDGTITSAELKYRTNGGAMFTAATMVEQGNGIFRGEIPGFAIGTQVDYYVEITDDAENITLDPANAPQVTYSFIVTDRVPQIALSPEQFNFVLKQGEMITDSILVSNQGLLTLHFSVSDSLLTNGSQQQNYPNLALSEIQFDFEKMKTTIMQSKYMRSGKINAELQKKSGDRLDFSANFESVLVDSPNDSFNDRADVAADLVAVSTKLSQKAFRFQLDFNREIGNENISLLMPVITDDWTGISKNNYGLYSNSNYLIFWDISNLLELPQAGVFIFDYSCRQLQGFAPIELDGRSALAEVPFHGAAGKNAGWWFKTLVIKNNDQPVVCDPVPDENWEYIGVKSNVPWMSEFPAQDSLSGEDSMYVYLKIDATLLEPGDYEAGIIFSSNDPLNSTKQIPVLLTVESGSDVDHPEAGDFKPVTFAILQNYPNPFNPETSIQYQLPAASHVVLRIYNLNGQEVKTLIEQPLPAGYYQVEWNGRNNSGQKVTSGVYILKIIAGEFVQAKKMILIQ